MAEMLTEIQVQTRTLEPGTHISRKTVDTIETRTTHIFTDKIMVPTGTIYGGYTVNLGLVEGVLRARGFLPYLGPDATYMISVKN
jgi:hypothetical protein